ncbi:hypothetical protein B484DRAFT_450766 [Ochromonadaceae sp. CCMP2298]|nr:hypothetical protein B484DRAFT_450766 [Ochromonadaceae sp. CCMP2298]
MGHMGLLHRCAHNVSVAATSLTTVYVLSKSDIAKLLAEQPTLSQQLQMALARAIATQSDIVGRMHMRSSRAEFLKSVKMRFYKHHDIDKKDVERVNKMMASRITQIKRSVSHVRQSVSFSRVPTAEHRSKDKAVVSLSEFDSERQCEPDSVRESRLGKGDESVGGGGGGWSGGTHVDDGLRNTSFDSRVAMPQGVGMGQTVGGLAQGSEQGLGQGHDVGDPGDASMGSPGGLGWVGIAGGEGEAEAEGLGLGMVGWPLSIDVPSDGDLGSHIDTPAPLRRQWSPNLFSLHGMGMGGMGMGGMGMGGMSMGGMGMGSTGMSMENTLEGICMRNMGIMGGGPQHRLSRDQLRSIKTLERVLGTEYTSDDDADADMVRGVIPIRHLLDPPHTHHHNHIHPTVHTPRAPLPAAQMLRSANLHPRPRVHSSTRKSLRLRKGPHPADEPPSIIGMLSLLLPEEAPAPHEQFRGIARTMSLSDIDMLDTLDAQQDGLQNPRNARRPSYGEEVEKTRSPSELLVPIWSNRRALHAPTLVRRQSFPSLDHQLWRTSKTAQGLL